MESSPDSPVKKAEGPPIFHLALSTNWSRKFSSNVRVQLPGIGEALAKRIVAYRRQQAADTGLEPVFRSLEDLDAVRGIGPKTLARMAEYLSFSATEEADLPEVTGSGDVDRSAQSALE